MQLSELVANLYLAKQQEEAAKARRVAFEADLARAIAVPDDWEGSKTRDVEEFKVRASRKMNHHIDVEKLRQLATENNIIPVLNQCFTWTPTINKKAWEAADESVRLMLAPAIETVPGKVCFTVKIRED